MYRIISVVIMALFALSQYKQWQPLNLLSGKFGAGGSYGYSRSSYHK